MMAEEKGTFRHESVQDRESVLAYLEAVAEGVRQGRLVLRSDVDELVVEPAGLLNLRVSVRRLDMHTRLAVTLSWADSGAVDVGGALAIDTDAADVEG
jgi:amphi-Trp domain-containing protein